MDPMQDMRTSRRRFLASAATVTGVTLPFGSISWIGTKKESSMSELQILMTGLVFAESPRWHDDRLWFADWGAQEVIAVDLAGPERGHRRVPSFPFFYRLAARWTPADRLGKRRAGSCAGSPTDRW